jgi:tetratricopeptide (TPR) repeat protein
VRAIYDWAKRLKTPTEAMPLLIDIVEASFDALQQSGDAKEYRQALELSLEYFGAERDDEREGLARAHVALLDWMQVRHLEGRAHAEAALRIANELGSLRLKALAQPCLANIEHALGNLDRAIALHLETVELLEGEHEKSMLGRMIIPSVRSRSFAAWFLAERGRFAEAQVQIDKAEAVLSSIEQPYSRVLLNAARGILAIRQERPHEAVAPLEQARELCMSLKFYVMEPCISGWLATALVSTGAHESARAIAGHSIDSELYLHGGRYTWVYVLQGLAEAQFACGACEEALATIARAVAIAEESKEPIHVAQARFARGQMRRASGLPDEGRQDVVAALSSAEKHGLDPLAAACRRALANAG